MISHIADLPMAARLARLEAFRVLHKALKPIWPSGNSALESDFKEFPVSY
jgi:hypothetical protein